MNLREHFRNFMKQREAAKLMDTFDQARGQEDMDSRDVRFGAALKLHYFHGIDAHENGFSQEGNDINAIYE